MFYLVNHGTFLEHGRPLKANVFMKLLEPAIAVARLNKWLALEYEIIAMVQEMRSYLEWQEQVGVNDGR